MTATPAEVALTRRALLPAFQGRIAYTIAFSMVMLLLVVAIIAPLIAPYDPDTIDILNANAPASSAHLLGTDASGRDILSRLIYGARIGMFGPFLVVVISVLIGVPVGVFAGYKGGWLDSVISRAVDVLLAFPPLLMAIVVVATFGAGFMTASLAIAVIYIPLVARVVRGIVISECQKDYVDAGRAQGFSGARLTIFHILPNSAGPIVAQSTLNFGYALLDLAGLAFLGLGTQPPTADWGQMLANGRENILYSTNELTAAVVVIAVTVLSFNVLGDALAKRVAR